MDKISALKDLESNGGSRKKKNMCELIKTVTQSKKAYRGVDSMLR